MLFVQFTTTLVSSIHRNGCTTPSPPPPHHHHPCGANEETNCTMLIQFIDMLKTRIIYIYTYIHITRIIYIYITHTVFSTILYSVVSASCYILFHVMVKTNSPPGASFLRIVTRVNTINKYIIIDCIII